MNTLLTKFLFAVLYLCAQLGYAQDLETKEHKWYVPSSVVLQHAGSIGMFNLAAGYKLNKSGKSTLDIGYGYVPAKYGGDLNILSAKFAYRPYGIRIKNWGTLYPTNPGVFLTYHAGGDFDSTWDDDDYPKGYYWWSTAFRPHISLSTEFKLDAKKLLPNLGVKSISIYSEFNTNELYGISYIQNSHDLDITGIFKLGIGTRVEF
ncbi:MAG TPA: hypothetical protein VF273_01565 [Pelobium sp.]